MQLSAWDSYAPTLLRWLLVGGGIIAIVVVLNRGLQALGVRGETARGIALVSPWILGLLIWNLFPFGYSLFLIFT
jgi:multiple sugar transport system permease protein